MKEYRVVYVTTPNEETSVQIARELVENELAACVNIVDKLRSIYRWEGRIWDESEQLLIIKTTAPLLGRLMAKVRALHPYDTPEIIALPIMAGNADYLDWIDAQTGGAPGEPDKH